MFVIKSMCFVVSVLSVTFYSDVLFAQHIGGAAELEPFEELARMVTQDLAWGGEKKPLVEAFTKERARLGKSFSDELIKFAESNSQRHYWCGLFLTSDRYLAGASKDAFLAIALWEQGIVLEQRGKNDPNSLRCFHYLLAIECAKQKLDVLAGHHKFHADRLFEERRASGPATSPEDMNIYELITPVPEPR
jgi:hypothetical protein